MVANEGALRSEFGAANCGVFAKLIDSARNVIARSLAKVQVRESDALKLVKPARRNVLVPKFPATSPIAMLRRSRRSPIVAAAATPGTSQTTENGTLSGYAVGADATGGEAWQGLIAEIIVTSNAISSTYRKRVEQYQRDFFGV